MTNDCDWHKFQCLSILKIVRLAHKFPSRFTYTLFFIPSHVYVSKSTQGQSLLNSAAMQVRQGQSLLKIHQPACYDVPGYPSWIWILPTLRFSQSGFNQLRKGTLVSGYPTAAMQAGSGYFPHCGNTSQATLNSTLN